MGISRSARARIAGVAACLCAVLLFAAPAVAIPPPAAPPAPPGARIFGEAELSTFNPETALAATLAEIARLNRDAPAGETQVPVTADFSALGGYGRVGGGRVGAVIVLSFASPMRVGAHGVCERDLLLATFLKDWDKNGYYLDSYNTTGEFALTDPLVAPASPCAVAGDKAFIIQGRTAAEVAEGGALYRQVQQAAGQSGSLPYQIKCQGFACASKVRSALRDIPLATLSDVFPAASCGRGERCFDITLRDVGPPTRLLSITVVASGDKPTAIIVDHLGTEGYAWPDRPSVYRPHRRPVAEAAN